MNKFNTILIIDDSMVFRTILKKTIGSLNVAEKTLTGVNGRSGLEIYQDNKDNIDLIIVDLEMPIMDGITFIKKAREIDPKLPILILSNQSIGGVNLTFKALELGANEFISKTNSKLKSNEEQETELKNKLQVFFNTCFKQIKKSKTDNGNGKLSAKDKIFVPKPVRYDLICIGSSTGGPEALKKVISSLDSNINIPIVIVQHMPPVFTEVLAKNLNQLTGLNVQEAKDGQKLEKRNIYIAPGDYHLEVKKATDHYFFKLNQNEKVCFVRPSVNVTIDSLIKHYSSNLALFILTGMGEDGKDACKKAKQLGATVLIQDEESSVVWGMPGAVYKENCFDDVLDIENIGPAINKIAS
jgi:two-component system chemotaxis response regulator CheB